MRITIDAIFFANLFTSLEAARSINVYVFIIGTLSAGRSSGL